MGVSLSPPSLDEIEVSVFGPGYGESILVHLGNNAWMVVDSCLDPATKEPYPISYLNQIGIDPRSSIKFIIATHWHDDHIQGLSSIVKECLNAKFVLSQALKSKEFLTLVNHYSERSMMESTGLDEFKKILEHLDANPSRIPIRAVEDRRLLSINKNFGSNMVTCEIFLLSPSDYAVYLSEMEISKLIPQKGTAKRKIVNLNPNHTSIVVHISIGNLCFLLGSDLEEINDLRTGWTKIISSYTRPKRKASLFKIPHHGSENADHPGIWSDLLESPPFAVLTHYARGDKYLPDKSDLKRIINSSKSQNVYLTAKPKWYKCHKRPRAVEKTIAEKTNIMIKRYNRTHGHVRLRIKPENNYLNWDVELFGEAYKIS